MIKLRIVSSRFLILTAIFAILLAVFFTPLISARAQEDVKKVVMDVDHAAIPHGDDWDSTYTDPGAVLYHDGKFHMFRNGFKAWPASVEIAYMVSDDGLTWEQVGEEPVLFTKDFPYADVAALASSVLVEDDGTWVLYVYTWFNPSDTDSQGAIARATAPAPEGPWTVDAQPILLPGSADDWDARQLVSPSVVKTDTGYVMYYNNIAPPTGGTTMIGMATSEDGITWTKYDNAETTDAPFANSDPIFLPNLDDSTAWDGENINQPRVVLNEEGFVMLYRSWHGAQQDQSIGFAISEDGLTWERLNEQAIFSDKDIKRRRMWFTALAYHEGTYYIYVELQRGYLGQTDIHAGTFAGPLR